MDEWKATIWIDLDNAPHIPFFEPIIKELKSKGYRVWVTASGRYQVAELAAMHGIEHTLVSGGYYGKNKVLKSVGILQRASLLLDALGKDRPHLALSHGSRSQIIAANMINMPVIVIIDYEFARFPLLKVDCVITPEMISVSPVPGCGCFCKYPGIKEDVYVPQFRPTGDVLDLLAIDPTKVIATIRPPATEAHYSNDESEDLFAHVVQRFAAKENSVMVMLPRNKKQEESIRERWPGLIRDRTLVIPDAALSGLSLMWESDLVISGGGTMNREAAALGIPVYSIFRGEIGAVDRHLSATGRMILIESNDDVDRLIVLRKRERQPDGVRHGNEALQLIIGQVEAVALNAALGGVAPSTRSSEIWKHILT